jgi:hypothetical protein
MKNYLNETEFTVKEMRLRNPGITRKQVECY